MSVIVQRANLLEFLFLGYLWQRLYFLFQKKTGDRRCWIKKKIKNIPKVIFKGKFSIFEKSAIFLFLLSTFEFKEFIDIIIPIKNVRLSSLKWYITCQRVTYGYFFIELKNSTLLKIHPVSLIFGVLC